MSTRTDKLTSNGLIDRLRGTPRFVVKTFTRVGPFYSLDNELRPLPREIVERQIDRGILVPREASEQSFELSASWGGR